MQKENNKVPNRRSIIRVSKKNDIKREDDIFSFDEEKIMGLKDLEKPNAKRDRKNIELIKKQREKSKKQNEKNKKKKEKNKKSKKKIIVKIKKEKILTEDEIEKLQEKKERNRIIRKRILRASKWLGLILLIIGGIIYFLLSPFFNIDIINVSGNEKLTKDEIISLSGIQKNQNMFKISIKNTEQGIKSNAYIENVQVKRMLPKEIDIIVSERKENFMIEFGNGYVYINNQGYILEVSNEKIDKPILVGLMTKEDEIKPGNRLCEEDLERLQDVLKIMNSVEENEMNNEITRIDVTNKTNYKLVLEKDGKTIHLGDTSNLSTKIVYAKEVLVKTSEEQGEIFVNNDVETNGAIFRKKV